MHNLKEIRKDFEKFKKQLKSRNIDINIDNLKGLDEKNRILIQKKEKLENEKKEISKSKDKSLFNRSKEISKELDYVSSDQKQIKIESNSFDISFDLSNKFLSLDLEISFFSLSSFSLF